MQIQHSVVYERVTQASAQTKNLRNSARLIERAVLSMKAASSHVAASRRVMSRGGSDSPTTRSGNVTWRYYLAGAAVHNS